MVAIYQAGFTHDKRLFRSALSAPRLEEEIGCKSGAF
jgi:hypothetical protein